MVDKTVDSRGRDDEKTLGQHSDFSQK
jgi:hypothetical protein